MTGSGVEKRWQELAFLVHQMKRWVISLDQRILQYLHRVSFWMKRSNFDQAWLFWGSLQGVMCHSKSLIILMVNVLSMKLLSLDHFWSTDCRHLFLSSFYILSACFALCIPLSLHSNTCPVLWVFAEASYQQSSHLKGQSPAPNHRHLLFTLIWTFFCFWWKKLVHSAHWSVVLSFPWSV